MREGTTSIISIVPIVFLYFNIELIHAKHLDLSKKQIYFLLPTISI